MLVYNQNEMNNKTFMFIYGCALHDAILQKSFEGKKDWIGKLSNPPKILRDYIDKVLGGDFKNGDEKTKQAHDIAFLETAIKLCDEINLSKPSYAEDDFSFGNAQKLINIAIKHVYTHTYTLDLIGSKNIREYFRFCHCPMDAIMLSHVWKTYKEVFSQKERAQNLTSGKDFLKSWGNEDFDVSNGEKVFPERYIQYQKAIKNIVIKKGLSVFPIEYDYIAWKND